jgi:hypothetical protein
MWIRKTFTDTSHGRMTDGIRDSFAGRRHGTGGRPQVADSNVRMYSCSDRQRGGSGSTTGPKAVANDEHKGNWYQDATKRNDEKETTPRPHRRRLVDPGMPLLSVSPASATFPSLPSVENWIVMAKRLQTARERWSRPQKEFALLKSVLPAGWIDRI